MDRDPLDLVWQSDDCRLRHRRMACKAQVVVAAEADDLSAAHAEARPACGGDLPQPAQHASGVRLRQGLLHFLPGVHGAIVLESGGPGQ